MSIVGMWLTEPAGIGRVGPHLVPHDDFGVVGVEFLLPVFEH